MDIDQLMDALDDYANKRDALKKCVDGCESDASYFCAYEYTARDRARQVLQGALDTYVDECINARLARLGLIPNGDD